MKWDDSPKYGRALYYGPYIFARYEKSGDHFLVYYIGMEHPVMCYTTSQEKVEKHAKDHVISTLFDAIKSCIVRE